MYSKNEEGEYFIKESETEILFTQNSSKFYRVQGSFM